MDKTNSPSFENSQKAFAQESGYAPSYRDLPAAAPITSKTPWSKGQKTFWDTYISTAPERMALEEEKRQMVEAHRLHEERMAAIQQSGPGLINILEQYEARNVPAVSTEVAQDFQAAFPADDFRTVLEEVKTLGLVHELVSSTQGFMGQKTTHLYLIRG